MKSGHTTISGSDGFSRRGFFRRAGVGVAGLAMLRTGRSVIAAGSPEDCTRLGEHLFVHHGNINVGVIRNGDRALLIDCGEGSVATVLPRLGIRSVDRILFTHHHRDQACGVDRVMGKETRIVVPAEERPWFENVAAYWNDPKSRWHLYNLHPHHLMLAESVRVNDVVRDGDVLTWGPARIRVLSTPGHTDGSVSYLVEVDGRRVVFSGDAIYDDGRVWDLHSLQKGIRRGTLQLTDYHGFLGAREELIGSLNRIKDAGPEMMVPSHGHIMNDPPKAVNTLTQRLNACYDKYVAISALRHYFPDLFREYADRPGQMPIRKGKPAPPFLRHFDTTWMILSEDKAAFVMDCGGSGAVRKIQELMAQGEVKTVEGLWVTHYHDDHTDGIPEFQKTFDCPCITDRAVARVISDPRAWRLPCVSPAKARVDRATKDGESWTWHEFKLTAYHFPGQTLYHSGLLVEGHGARMLFVGDSFTMGGIDDYCSGNRNWLGRGVGFDRCIALIEELQPTHIFNCHVDDAFDFTPEQCRFMRANLADRKELFRKIVPWDHANYGMDEPWVRCHPYEQDVKAGDSAEIRVVVTNHSHEERPAACRIVLPRAWGKPSEADTRPAGSAPADESEWQKAIVLPKTEQEIMLKFRIPPGIPPGRHVVCVDLQYGTWSLPQFTEAIVAVGS